MLFKPTIDIITPSENVDFNLISSVTGVIPLADPELHSAKPIDLILSADFMRLLIGESHSLSNGLVQQNSVFGQLLSGKLSI